MFSAGDSFADAALWSETVKDTRSVLADLGSVKERLLVGSATMIQRPMIKVSGIFGRAAPSKPR